MKIRTSTAVMLAVWFGAFVLYILVRPDGSSGLPLKMIPLLTQTEESAPTTTHAPATTTSKPSTTTPTSPPTESTPTSGSSQG
ncbi:hypothetical protein [Smaragdicoccus niigatensis]|uniref:hypothetical protein n=1 Tax=Smaragdicoccus niigatensis TaxID=359359 RepID=UPI0003605C6E|nr:hypothetical protein [Smaragdicoccus niigatensis]